LGGSPLHPHDLEAEAGEEAREGCDRVIVQMLVVDGIEPGVLVHVDEVPDLHYEQAVVAEPVIHPVEYVREVVDVGAGVV
jgi:hypothetical protein